MTDQERWGQFITRLAEALGVEEEVGGGFAEDRILQAIADLKAARALPDFTPRLMQLQARVAELEAIRVVQELMKVGA